MTRVERRGFIVGTLSLLAAPLTAEGQAPQRVFRIGSLTLEPRPSNVATSNQILRRELLALGWVEGQHSLPRSVGYSTTGRRAGKGPRAWRLSSTEF